MTADAIFRRLLRRRQARDLLGPILDEVELGRARGIFAANHDEMFAVGKDVVEAMSCDEEAGLVAAEKRTLAAERRGRSWPCWPVSSRTRIREDYLDEP